MIYTSPPPVKKSWEIIEQSGVLVTHTGTDVVTTVKTITVPAGVMGANGVLRIEMGGKCDGAEEKYINLEFDGSLIEWFGIASGDNKHWQLLALIHNANSESSQNAHIRMWDNTTLDKVGVGNPRSVDTTLDKNLTLDVELLSAAGLFTLENCLVEVSHKV